MDTIKLATAMIIINSSYVLINYHPFRRNLRKQMGATLPVAWLNILYEIGLRWYFLKHIFCNSEMNNFVFCGISGESDLNTTIV